MRLIRYINPYNDKIIIICMNPYTAHILSIMIFLLFLRLLYLIIVNHSFQVHYIEKINIELYNVNILFQS